MVHDDLALTDKGNIREEVIALIQKAVVTKSSGVMLHVFSQEDNKAKMRALLQAELKTMRNQGLKEKECLPQLLLEKVFLALAMRSGENMSLSQSTLPIASHRMSHIGSPQRRTHKVYRHAFSVLLRTFSVGAIHAFNGHRFWGATLPNQSESPMQMRKWLWAAAAHIMKPMVRYNI
eukprot:1137680-Amphidinium_carterae.3